jgi:hypothetical protein
MSPITVEQGNRAVYTSPASRTAIEEAIRMVSNLTGISPNDMTTVEFNANGTVTIQESLRNERGNHYLVDGELASRQRIFNAPPTTVSMEDPE